MTDELSDEDTPSPDTSPEPLLGDTNSFVFGYSSSNVNLKPFHPLPSQVRFYANVFEKNVDPIYKVIHKPSLAKLIKEVEAGLDTLTRVKEALLFAVYFAVVTRYSYLRLSKLVSTYVFLVYLLKMLMASLGLKRQFYLTDIFLPLSNLSQERISLIHPISPPFKLFSSIWLL